MDISQINLLLMILGGLLLFFELASGFLKIHLFLSEPIVALFAGILVGPYVLHILDMNEWGSVMLILEEIARLTLAVTLIGIAFRMPNHFVIDKGKDLAILIGIVLPLMWLVSGALIYLFFGFPILISLLIGAVVAPTDPVVSSAIVTGDAAEKNIPAGLRHIISAESAANDALTMPFVMIPLLLMANSPDSAFSDFLIDTLLMGTIGATIMGIVLGWISGKFILWTESKPHVDRHSLVAVTLSLALTALGMVKLLGMDGLLAVFVAGLTFNLVIGDKFEPKPEGIQEVVRRFIDLPIFFLFGLVMPWEKWFNLGWPALLLPLAIILFRRLPALLFLQKWIRSLKTLPDTLFAGWFGPIGVAAIYYATFAVRKTGHEEIWIVTSLIIFASLVVYGLSDMPFTLWYGKCRRARSEVTGQED